jgi:hypothetical protein
MDVHCSSCDEPWDVYHLRHEAIFEIDLDQKAKAWRNLTTSERLSCRYREKFKAAGYEFGASVLDVIHCPACPKGAKPNPDLVDVKARLVGFFGDDDDAIASSMEDLGL